MPVSPEQDAAIDRMAHQFPPEGVRVQPNRGPDHDRAVVLFPSGRQVVLDVDGEILGDSGRESCLIPPWRTRGGEMISVDIPRNWLAEHPFERIKPLRDWLYVNGEKHVVASIIYPVELGGGDYGARLELWSAAEVENKRLPVLEMYVQALAKRLQDNDIELPDLLEDLRP